jgi:hypothetical protein
MFNHIDDLSNNSVVIQGGDEGIESIKNKLDNLLSFDKFESFVPLFILNGNIVIDNLFDDEDENEDDEFEISLIKISTSNNTANISANFSFSGNIAAATIGVKKIGLINNQPYYSMSFSVEAPSGKKIVITGEDFTLVDYNSNIKGVEKISLNIPFKYTLREVNGSNIEFNISERTPFNKEESNFDLKQASFTTNNKQLKNINDIGDDITPIFNSITELIQNIIPNGIGTTDAEINNDFILPTTHWNLAEDNIQIERIYKNFITNSTIESNSYNIEIKDSQFSFSNKSFHSVRIELGHDKAIKINNGKFEYSTDDDAFTEMAFLFTSDIEEN